MITSNEAYDFDLTLEPGRASAAYWADLWRYRELLLVLAQRDISVRYKQTVMGIVWAIVQPLLTMLVMTVVFGHVAGLRAEGGAPYAVMVFAAMLPWMFFSSALAFASQSMVTNANLISKVYFPRLIVPVSALATSCVDLFVSFLALLALIGWYGFDLSWRVLSLPVFVVLACAAALGPGLLVTALNVKYRDFKYVIPFLVQVGLYISPVGFSASVVRHKLGDAGFILYSLNPVVGVIEGFRWAILGARSPVYAPAFAASLLSTAALLVVGIQYFRRTERAFADII